VCVCVCVRVLVYVCVFVCVSVCVRGEGRLGAGTVCDRPADATLTQLRAVAGGAGGAGVAGVVAGADPHFLKQRRLGLQRARQVHSLALLLLQVVLRL
jgi:hypothetical protein